jgi:hypothetical protein
MPFSLNLVLWMSCNGKSILENSNFGFLVVSDTENRTSNHDQNLLDLGFTTDAAPYMYFPGECEEPES